MTLRFLMVLFAFVFVAAFQGVKVSQAQEQHSVTGSITLTWTAPGDDSLSGMATLYDLRFSYKPITEENFPFAYRIAVIQPLTPGSSESYMVQGLLNYYDYYFAVRTADDAGNWSRVSNVVYRPAPGITLESIVIREFAFSAPRPNPARNRAQFTLTMPEPGESSVEAFDLSGRRVASIASGFREAGPVNLNWDLRDERGNFVGSGIYLVRARFGAKEILRRITVVR